jgi:hypothetical protein
MKTNFKTLGVALLVTMTLISCSDDDNNNNQNQAPTAAEFNAIKEIALENKKQNFTLDADAGSTTFTSENGVQFTLNGTCLTKNGNTVTGMVEIEFIELFDGGSMLVTNKTTMGKLPNGDMSLIISGGEFYINATQNGVNLDLTCAMQVVIPTALTNGAQTGMVLWDGIIDENGNLDWDEQEVNPVGQNGVFVEGQGANSRYYTFFNSFGWTNVDKFYDDPRPRTTILAKAPNGYDNLNSAIYLHYDGEANALANLDTYDASTQQFSEHYGQIPIGLNCHVIFATEENGQWRYAIKGTTIAAGDIYTFTMSETTVGTEAQLVAAINALP